MTTLRMEVELEIDDVYTGEHEWIIAELMSEELILYSGSIGDEVGAIRVLRIED